MFSSRGSPGGTAADGVAKPWARIEIGYLGHPKFLALNANAICLWHEGKQYCDMHHTDGLIPTVALKTFRFAGRRSIEMLLSTCPIPKPDGTPYAPLWHVHSVGYAMHDYLEHNDGSEAVRGRMRQADERRMADRERLRRWREAKKQPETPFQKRARNGSETLLTETETLSETKVRTLAAFRVEFDRFWAVYPRKVGRDAALRVWAKLKPDAALTDAMIAAVRRQLPTWDDPKFIPHPSTWLNGGRWKDEVQPQRPRVGPSVDVWSHCSSHTPPCASEDECRSRNYEALAAKIAAKKQAQV